MTYTRAVPSIKRTDKELAMVVTRQPVSAEIQQNDSVQAHMDAPRRDDLLDINFDPNAGVRSRHG